MTRPRRPRRPVKRLPGESTIINRRGGSRQWTKITEDFCKRNRICWLRLPGCTVRAVSIDHFYPRKTHPHLALVPSNWRPACKWCNEHRNATPHFKLPELRARMEKQMRPPGALAFFNRRG